MQQGRRYEASGPLKHSCSISKDYNLSFPLLLAQGEAHNHLHSDNGFSSSLKAPLGKAKKKVEKLLPSISISHLSHAFI